MTTREIADAAGISSERVRIKAREMFPTKFAKGKKTDFDERESFAIMAELRKKNFVQPPRDKEVPPQNKEVPDYVTRADLAEFGRALVQEMFKQMTPLLVAPRAIPQIEQDYFTIRAYAARNGERVTVSEARILGKEASLLSREAGLEIRQADDETYGYVNAYHVSVLERAFRL